MNYKHAPAMINRRLSKHYDLFVNAVFVGVRLQKRTLGKLELKDGDALLDVGCGSGTLALLVKETNPGVSVSAIDPGDTVINVAKIKALKKNIEVDFIQSGAEALPFKDRSFDVVTSSLAFHHMPTYIKEAALAEIKRVLKNDGTFVLVDIGKPKNWLWKILCGVEAIIEPKEYIKDNLEGRIPGRIEKNGFRIAQIHEPYMGIYTWVCKK